MVAMVEMVMVVEWAICTGMGMSFVPGYSLFSHQKPDTDSLSVVMNQSFCVCGSARSCVRGSRVYCETFLRIN